MFKNMQLKKVPVKGTTKNTLVGQNWVNNNSWFSSIPVLSNIIYAFRNNSNGFLADQINPSRQRSDTWSLSGEISHMNKILTLTEKMQERNNWNYFVGDQRFKTNFFLQFLSATTANIYELQVIAGSLYSIRLWPIL